VPSLDVAARRLQTSDPDCGVRAEELGASPTAAEAEDSADLAGQAPEEAARKLASQNRLLRTKLRAVYRAEEENAKLRLQVEHLAEQLVRLPHCLCQTMERRVPRCQARQAKRTVRLTHYTMDFRARVRTCLFAADVDRHAIAHAATPPPDVAKADVCAG